MHKCFVLVKNLRSNSRILKFSDFKLWKVGSDRSLKETQQLFPKRYPLYEDYVFEKSYEDKDSERIPFDIEDTLLLFRLFGTGDIFFTNPQIEDPNGDRYGQATYPVMVYNNVTHSKYRIETNDCQRFDTFVSNLLSMPNWSSHWFKIARRFFLYGGGKEYNPIHNLVDRVVDYMIVLEAILVPEKDFVGRRLRERAVSLLIAHKINPDDTKRLLRDFYNVRSTIVHGGDMSVFKNNVLNRIIDFETIVRKIIIEALRVFPNGNERRVYLKRHFDICDKDRSLKVYNDFCSIKKEAEKANCRDLILKRF